MHEEKLFRVLHEVMAPNLFPKKHPHQFHHNFRRLRLKFMLPKKELARLLNVDISTISNYEHGRRHPNFDTLLQIADIFGVTVDDLLR